MVEKVILSRSGTVYSKSRKPHKKFARVCGTTSLLAAKYTPETWINLVYLGISINYTNSLRMEIKRRITLANVSWESTWSILENCSPQRLWSRPSELWISKKMEARTVWALRRYEYNIVVKSIKIQQMCWLGHIVCVEDTPSIRVKLVDHRS